MSKFKKIKKVIFKDVKVRYYFYFVLLFLNVATTMFSSYSTKALIDCLTNEPFAEMDILEKAYFYLFGGHELLSNNVWAFAIIIIGFALISVGLAISRFLLRSYTITKMGKNLQDELFYHIERLPYPVIKSLPNGDLIQTCTKDESTVLRYFTFQRYMIVHTIFLVSTSFIILSITNYQIALVSLSLLPFMFIYSFFIIKEVRRRYRLTDDSEGEMTSKIEENLSSVRLVKAFNNERFEITEFEKYIDDYQGKFIRWKKLSSFFYGSSDIFVFAQIALTSVFGFYLCFIRYVNNDPMGISVGTLAISFTFVNMIVWPVRDVATIISNFAQALAAADRINLIFDEPLEDIDSGVTPTLDGTIEFKNVGFKFADSSIDNLSNLSFKIKPGQTVAIMGKTGSGKSTLSYLLARLYDNTSGEILLNDVNIKEIKRTHLRENVSIVLQEPFLFSKTIEDNIKLVTTNASETDILEATKTSFIHDSILKFKDGYRTAVGEKGVTLSGGQKQRLSIARTLVKKSPIIIFDDSLSAVDTDTDFKIREALKARKNKSTMLIITHRVATAKDADLIIVLNDGTIEALGTHDELIKKKGLYKRVNDIQTKME